MTGRSDQTPSDSWLRGIFDLIMATTFLSVIGCLFVAFAVLMGKYELLVLAYVLLGAACIRSLLSPERRQKLERTAVVGEGLKIFNRLEAYYLHQPPRSMLYYLFFPITGIWSFFFAKDRGRYELKAYWGLLQWILVLLFVGGFASYMRFYQHFDWKFSVTWVYMELLAIYFLCNFFAVPLSTTSLRLSLDQKRFRLFATTGISLVVLTGFLFVFAYRTNYDNLIPMNIMLDKRLADFKSRVMKPQGPKPLHKSLLQYEDQKPYFDRILRTTQTFLAQHAERIRLFNQQYLFAPNNEVRRTFFAQLNKRYQERLAPIATMGEHKQFFLTVTQMPRTYWVLVCIPFRESAFYFFQYNRKRVRLYKHWRSIPGFVRRRLLASWNRNYFEFSQDKRMAQLVVEFMRDKFQRASENLDMITPRKQDDQLAKNKAKENKQQSTRDLAAPPKSTSGLRAPSVAPAPGTPPRARESARRYRSARRRRRPRRRIHRRRRKSGAKKRIMPRPAGKGANQARRDNLPRARKRPPIQWGQRRRPAPVAPIRKPSFHDPAGPVTGRQRLISAMQTFDDTARAIQHDFKRLFGIAPQSKHLTPGSALLAMFPKPWKVRGHEGFQKWLSGVVAQDVPMYKRALNYTGPRWKPPAPRRSRLEILQERLRKKEASYKRTRSMYTWAQASRLKREIATLKEKQARAVLPPRPPHQTDVSSARLSVLAAAMRRQNNYLVQVRRALKRQWNQNIRHYRRHFSVHSPALVSFDYKRALSARLLYDHFGKTPELVQTWWTRFYEFFLSVIMLLFQIAMPVHILLILFCQLRFAEIFPILQSEESTGSQTEEMEVSI